MRYKTWLWWTRFAIVITVFQLVGATFLMINMAKLVSNGDPSSNCVLGKILFCHLSLCCILVVVCVKKIIFAIIYSVA